MEDRFSRPMRGTLRLRVVDRAGRVVTESVGHNLIVAGGYEAAAEALAGVAGLPLHGWPSAPAVPNRPGVMSPSPMP